MITEIFVLQDSAIYSSNIKEEHFELEAPLELTNFDFPPYTHSIRTFINPFDKAHIEKDFELEIKFKSPIDLSENVCPFSFYGGEGSKGSDGVMATFYIENKTGKLKYKIIKGLYLDGKTGESHQGDLTEYAYNNETIKIKKYKEKDVYFFNIYVDDILNISFRLATDKTAISSGHNNTRLWLGFGVPGADNATRRFFPNGHIDYFSFKYTS